MTDNPHQDASTLVRLAGLDLPPDRLAVLQLGLATVRTAIAVLMARDYGEAEPASRFRPRPAK